MADLAAKCGEARWLELATNDCGHGGHGEAEGSASQKGKNSQDLMQKNGKSWEMEAEWDSFLWLPIHTCIYIYIFIYLYLYVYTVYIYI